MEEKSRKDVKAWFHDWILCVEARQFIFRPKVRLGDEVDEQEGHLENLKESLCGSGLHFDYEISWDSMHARSIKTVSGWKITLDRGLDIFQPHSETPFELGRINQEARRCKPFEVTYLKEEDVSFEVNGS